MHKYQTRIREFNPNNGIKSTQTTKEMLNKGFGPSNGPWNLLPHKQRVESEVIRSILYGMCIYLQKTTYFFKKKSLNPSTSLKKYQQKQLYHASDPPVRRINSSHICQAKDKKEMYLSHNKPVISKTKIIFLTLLILTKPY